MEPALDVVNRALQGDSGSRSFLERTTSLYVLDVTDASNPKTYGCWNFIHQAMNEIERYEARSLNGESNGSSLSYHVRMLASMALKVARRSPAADKTLVITCTSNASQYHGSTDQSQWLVDLNLELREIVMGRIAAMAFDFSFHRQSWSNGKSAFADHVALDTFCAVLSANAVSSGPKAVGTFATEWIIPSSKSLPTFSVASVVLHLAAEGMRTSAPVGTKDTLQQLSFPIMSIVLVPILADSLTMNHVEANGTSIMDESSQIAAMSLRAMKIWCDSTDLSLPLIKHICSKVNVDVVEVLSDTMYSDSALVIDALAEFIETTVVVSDEKIMSSGRMSQVRHIIQPDVSSFQTQVTGQQLKIIESREMFSIVDDLMSAIGLQRFRFVDRQIKGDLDVCRNLARIASSVCDTWVDIVNHANPTQSHVPEVGATAILLKGANHPSVNICAISLQPLTRLMPLVPTLSLELLPMLQRRAITPHHLKGGQIDLDAVDLCGVTIHDFLTFRLSVLSDALFACWKENAEHYMDSCTSAIEEFCSSTSSIDVSLQAEAALFCIEQILLESIRDSQGNFPIENVMSRLVKSLMTKPSSVMSNPLTRESMCCFIRKCSRWFTTNRAMDVAMDLIVASFYSALIPTQIFSPDTDIYCDSTTSCVHEASLALKEMLLYDPVAFEDPNKLGSVLGLWEKANVTFAQPRSIHVGDRIVIGSAIGQVLSCLSDDVRLQAYDGMMKFPLGRLEQWLQQSQSATSSGEILLALKNVGDDISVVASLCHAFAYPKLNSETTETTESQPISGEISEAVLSIFQKAWPYITLAATKWGNDENVAQGIAAFLLGLLPPTCDNDNGLKLIMELCQLASLVLQSPRSTNKTNFDSVVCFVETLLETYGSSVEKTSNNKMDGIPLYSKDIGNALKSMIWKIIETEQAYLGSAWTCPTEKSEQGNGQAAYESQPSPSPKFPAVKSSVESLCGVLLFLTQGMVSCPSFIMHIPTVAVIENGFTTDHHDNSDMLIRRATHTAMISLDEHNNADIVQAAVSFLFALVQFSIKLRAQQYPGTDNDMQWMSRLYPDIICKLLTGVCGKYEYTILDNVTELLVSLLQRIYVSMSINSTILSSSKEMELYIFSSSIRQQYDQLFLFGDHARQVTLHVLFQYSAAYANAASVRANGDNDNIIMSIPSSTTSKILSDVTILVQDVWQLHQIDDPNALAASDGVNFFITKYSSST